MKPHQRLSEHAWQALSEALRTYHWFKREFQTMVRHHFAQAPDALASVNFDETKRIATGQLVESLRRNEGKHQDTVIDALMSLSGVDPKFPHLARLDNGQKHVKEAKAALQSVKDVIHLHREAILHREAVLRQSEDRKMKESKRLIHKNRLSELQDTFMGLHDMSNNTQERGYGFERLLNDLFELWDLNPRAAYSIEHEQIDGAFTLRTDDYILEARWCSKPLQPKDLNDFKVKVDGKARNTLGLCVSISGFTDGAIAKHSGAQTPLILMDGLDLMTILEGRIDLIEVLERKRRHAAETGNPMYRVGT